MPSRYQTNYSYYRFRNRRRNSQPTSNRQVEQAVNEQQDSNAEQNNRTEINDEQGNRTKWTDVVGLFIDIILAGLTFLLFTKTIEANNTSFGSLIEAKRANDHIIFKDSIDRINDSITQIRQNIKDSLSINLAANALQTQIKSVQETQRQFEVANTPYLQLERAEIVFNDAIRQIAINITLSNAGLHPAQVVGHKTGYGFGDGISIDTLKRGLIRDTRQATPVNMYAVKEYPRTSQVTISNVAPNTYYLVKNRGLPIYIYGKYFYTNLVNQKKRTLEFAAKLIYTPEATMRHPLMNENIYENW